MLTLTIIRILKVILDVTWWIIIAQFVVSLLFAFNVVNRSNGGVRSIAEGLDRVTEPLYRPIRRFLPVMGGLDFSPLVVLVLMQIINIVLDSIAVSALTGGLPAA